jgi:hypothetical protein
MMRGLDLQRRPVAVAHRKREALGHHADNGVSGGAEADGAADDVWFAAKPRLPDVVADHEHGCTSRPSSLARIGRPSSGAAKAGF